MSPVPMMGFSELLLIVLMGSGLGVPLGVPPQDPDPVLANVAPAECLYLLKLGRHGGARCGQYQPDGTVVGRTGSEGVYRGVAGGCAAGRLEIRVRVAGQVSSSSRRRFRYWPKRS